MATNSPRRKPTSGDDLYSQGSPLGFKIIFVDLQKVVCDALVHATPKAALLEGEINVHQGVFEEHLDVDCIVSSSNAFGLMDHGFDRALCKVLGSDVRERVQSGIGDQYHGEQPVGTCLLIQTGNDKIPFVAHAPTRRINYSIRGTDNVYLAMRAVCIEVLKWNTNNKQKIKKVLCTGLGTFYGALPAEESARQTILAWLTVRLPIPEASDITWDYAKNRQACIKYGGWNHFMDELLGENEIQLTKDQLPILEKKIQQLQEKASMKKRLSNNAYNITPNKPAENKHKNNKHDNSSSDNKNCILM